MPKVLTQRFKITLKRHTKNIKKTLKIHIQSLIFWWFWFGIVSELVFFEFWGFGLAFWRHFGSTSGPMTPPRVPPGLQNEALEPPKFTKNSDLDPPRCQEVAPEASEVPLRPKIWRKSLKIRSKFNRKMCRILAQSNENFTASSVVKLHAKIQWPRRSGRSPLGYELVFSSLKT